MFVYKCTVKHARIRKKITSLTLDILHHLQSIRRAKQSWAEGSRAMVSCCIFASAWPCETQCLEHRGDLFHVSRIFTGRTPFFQLPPPKKEDLSLSRTISQGLPGYCHTHTHTTSSACVPLPDRVSLSSACTWSNTQQPKQHQPKHHGQGNPVGGHRY